MFTLQIQCATIEDAERIIATLKYGAPPAVVQDLASQLPFSDAAGLSDAESPAAKYFPGTTNDAVLAQQAPTLDDARAALKAVQAKYGTDDMTKPLEILDQFSAGRISEVKSDQYPAFIAACKAA